MKRIDIIFEKLKELDSGDGVSATLIADALDLSRANVSSDLNKLAEEGRIAKDDSERPVLFKIIKDEVKENRKENIFDRFSETNQSLHSAIEQAKAAVLYPPKGMNMLILGETGVGKSMFAALIHKYAIDMKLMKDDAPFIVFNCADYASNPQLLMGQLFGTKKGAFTGADSDKVGLIEKADEGILFLDEVHRLPPEGQEMFFTFIDRGTFRRLGETEQERKAKVLIITATTEEPGSTLLKTFTRRIPMVITIPNLKERTLEERFSLISEFMREESFRLNRKIEVTVNSMRALLSYNCTNNIGQLKTDIQLACAKAYADFVAGKKDGIRISSMDLASYIREGLYMETEHRQLWNKLIGINARYCIFDKSEDSMLLQEEENEKNIYDMIDMRVRELKGKGASNDEIEKEMGKEIDEYYTKYIYSVNKEVDTTNLENIVGPDIIRVVEEIISFSEERLHRILSRKVYYGMAVHIANSIDRVRNGRRIVNPQLNKIRTEYRAEFDTAVDCIKIIERVFDITIPIDEAGFLAMFFIYNYRGIREQKNEVKVIVIAHGNSTATSMADTANSLLGIKHAVGINALLDEKPQQVIARLKNYLVEAEIVSDLLLLVDMGSLTTFGEELEKELGIKIKTIPLVSTLHVIEAARKSSMGYSLEEVYKDTLSVNNFLVHEAPENKKIEELSEKLAIVTICTTGEGSAVTIKNLLQKQLQFDKNLLEIIPVNLVGNESINARLKNIEKEYRIVCVVSPFDIEIKMPLFDLQGILSNVSTDEIQNLIDIEIMYIKMGETLENQLVNINGRDALKDIKAFIAIIEKDLDIKVDTSFLIGITFHIGCMLDRLKAQVVVDEFEDRDAYIKQNSLLHHIVSKACEKLNNKYDVKISEDEICYIMVFFNPKNFIK
jgi:transcriptional regulatory protein LevR/transcriptional regulator with AAA-type ATPase domain